MIGRKGDVSGEESGDNATWRLALSSGSLSPAGAERNSRHYLDVEPGADS